MARVVALATVNTTLGNRLEENTNLKPRMARRVYFAVTIFKQKSVVINE